MKANGLIRETADAWGLNPAHLTDAVNWLVESERSRIESLRRVIAHARRVTGLTSRRCGQWEDAGHDHVGWPGLDATARELAGQYPDLGIGRGYDPDCPDYDDVASRLWDLLREPTPPLPTANDPDLVRRAAELLKQAGDPGPNMLALVTVDRLRLKKVDLDAIRAGGNRVLLSFSCGKDSVATWCFLKRHGFDLVPFYMQLVPGLKFVERSLTYYERFFDTHIYRTIHPSLYHWLDALNAQPPGRKDAIDFLKVPLFDYPDVARGVARTAGLKWPTWVAVGIRRAESRLRANRILPDGLNRQRRNFYPIAEFSKADVIAELKQAGVKLPIDYQIFGRSFDGLDYRFLSVIRERFPDDYRLILDWFPGAHAEIVRANVARTHGQAR
jgi:hypothetical protein